MIATEADNKWGCQSIADQCHMIGIYFNLSYNKRKINFNMVSTEADNKWGCQSIADQCHMIDIISTPLSHALSSRHHL